MFRSITSNLVELRAFGFWLLVFLGLDKLIQWISPEAGTIDSGWFQVLASGALKVTFIALITWVIFENCFPTFRDLIKQGGFKRLFDECAAHHRLWAFVACFGLVLWAVVSSMANA
jgi:hypothetical protein